MTVKDRLVHTETGLPAGAFAIVGDPQDAETWKLPHHKMSISRTLRGKLDIERAVDWEQMVLAVAALSPRTCGEQRLYAFPEVALDAARHLAEHYRKAGKPLPDTLAAIV